MSVSDISKTPSSHPAGAYIRMEDCPQKGDNDSRPCVMCGATVVGNDAVGGVCQIMSFIGRPVGDWITRAAITNQFSGFDLDNIRQWFDAVQDTTPRYLEQHDYELASRIYLTLNLPVPKSVARHLEGDKDESDA